MPDSHLQTDSGTEPFVLSFGVDGAGPFDRLRSPFELEFRAGVNVLVAPNNWGKSWTMRLLARFNADKLSVGDLTVNDDLTGGIAKAWVNGATMRARAGRAPDLDGTPPPIDALPEAIAVLAHGGHMKGDKPAFKARLGALLHWVAMSSTEDVLRQLLGEDPKIAALYGRIIAPNGELKHAKPARRDITLVEGVDLIEAASRIREAIHSMRRSQSVKLEVAKANIDGINGRKREIVDGAGLAEARLSGIKPAVDDTQEELGRARTEHATLNSRRLSGLAELGRRAQALQDLGIRPDPGPKLAAAKRARRAADKVDDDMVETRSAVENLRAELARAEEKLRGLEDRAAERVGAADAAETEHRTTVEAAERWDRLNAELTAELEVPEEHEVEEARRAVDVLEKRLTHHRAAVRYQAVTAELEAEHESAGDLEDRVTFLKSEADEVWSRLAAAVNRELEGDRVRVGEDETIEIRVGRRWFDITDQDRVGEGVTFNACYELLLKHRKGQRVIVIEGHTTVDPEHLEALALRAREQGTVLILERVPVRDEPMPESGFKLEVYPDGGAS